MSPRPLPQPLKEKLSKLLPRLTSPYQGEVVATVAAIERALIAHGVDIHDLAYAVTNNVAAQTAQPTGTASHREMDGDALFVLTEAIRNHGGLSERSRDFLASLEERAAEYDRVFLTEKQLKWLMDLAKRAGVVT